MRSLRRFIHLGLTTALVSVLGACAGHAGHHPTTPNAQAPAAKGAMTHGSKMDRVAMCEKYSQMSPGERRARMQAHHKDMSQEMLEQHDKMMRDQCAALER